VEKRTCISTGWIVRVTCVIIILTPPVDPREIRRARWIHKDEISPIRQARVPACRRRCVYLFTHDRSYLKRGQERGASESIVDFYLPCLLSHPPTCASASVSVMLIAAVFRKITQKPFRQSPRERIELIAERWDYRARTRNPRDTEIERRVFDNRCINPHDMRS